MDRQAYRSGDDSAYRTQQEKEDQERAIALHLQVAQPHVSWKDGPEDFASVQRGNGDEVEPGKRAVNGNGRVQREHAELPCGAGVPGLCRHEQKIPLEYAGGEEGQQQVGNRAGSGNKREILIFDGTDFADKDGN